MRHGVYVGMFAAHVVARLFIPVPFGNVEDANTLVEEKTQNELEGGVDPFLAPSGEGKKDENTAGSNKSQEESKNESALVGAEDKKGEKDGSSNEAKRSEKKDADNSKAALGKPGSAQKTELDEILQENILEAEMVEPSKLGPGDSFSKDTKESAIKPGDSFWTEVNVNGKKQNILVKVKQVTIIQKVATDDVKSTASQTASKAPAEQFPFIKIQLPGIFKSTSASVSSLSSTKDIRHIFSSLFRTDTSATPSRSSSTEIKASTSKSEKPTVTVVQTTPGASSRSADKSATKTAGSTSTSEAEKSKGIFGGSSKPDTANKTSTSDDKPFKNIASIMSGASKTAAKNVTETRYTTSTQTAEKPASQDKSTTSAKKEEEGARNRSTTSKRPESASVRFDQSSSRYNEKGKTVSTQTTSISKKGEPTSLGDIFDVLKNMPGSSSNTTKNTFIEGQFTFPKEKEMGKKVFKLSGYIST